MRLSIISFDSNLICDVGDFWQNGNGVSELIDLVVLFCSYSCCCCLVIVVKVVGSCCRCYVYEEEEAALVFGAPLVRPSLFSPARSSLLRMLFKSRSP